MFNCDVGSMPLSPYIGRPPLRLGIAFRAMTGNDLALTLPRSHAGDWISAHGSPLGSRRPTVRSRQAAATGGPWTSPRGVEGSLTNPITPGGQDVGGAITAAVHR